jgi:hypothetical protein
MFRFRVATTSALAATVSRRFVKSSDPTYEDDRWLEAQFNDAEKTIEERYAADKQKEVLKKMLAKIREENDKKVDAKIAEVNNYHTDARAKETAELKASIADLQKKLEKLVK